MVQTLLVGMHYQKGVELHLNVVKQSFYDLTMQ